MSTLLKWFKRRRKPGRGLPPHPLDAVLESEARQLHAVDPETARHWHLLQLSLGRQEAPQQVRPARAPVRVPRVAFAGAAAVALLLVTAVLWLTRTTSINYETGKGRQMSVTLADSSVVTLNHTSELIVQRRPLERSRLVSLKGEAFFRVRSTGTPFVISTDVASVRVLGTEFNVRVRDDRLEVAVVRGRVQVSARRDGKDSAVVLAGGQITTCSGGGFPGTPGAIPLAEYPGWTHGKFVFYRSSLSAVCEEIQSRFDVTVRVENPRAANETMTGTLNGGSIDAALSGLAALTGKKYRYENDAYILY